MIGVVICTHGELADHLLATARMIVGDYPAASTVGVPWQASSTMGFSAKGAPRR